MKKAACNLAKTALFTSTLVLTLAGCGGVYEKFEEKDQEPAVIHTAESFRGTWNLAQLELGKGDPVAVGCVTKHQNTGVMQQVGVSNEWIHEVIMDYIADPNCEGKSYLLISDSYEVRRTSSEQKDGITTETYTLGTGVLKMEVVGEETAAKLNALGFCGRTDWEPKYYYTHNVDFTKCTAENTKGTSMPSIKLLNDKWKRELRLKTHGKGLEFSSRDTRIEGSEFGAPTYFSPAK